jgi:hypothetical protein
VVDPNENDPTSISANTWFVSYPIGGNYWSDYAGIDVKSGNNQNEEGSDGLGDSAYVINNINQDNYPLVPEGTLYVYITSPENKTYNQDSITLTYTTSDTNSIIGYSLDGQTNITITGTTTLSNLSEGSHKLTVFAKDTEGNEKSNTVYFTISEEAETPNGNEDTDSFPITLIVILVAILALVAIVLFYIFRMRKS